MKPIHLQYIATGLAALCAILGLALLILGSSARSLQSELRTLQAQFEGQSEQINAAIAIRQQVIPNLFADLAKNPEDVTFKALLSKHGANPGTEK